MRSPTFKLKPQNPSTCFPIGSPGHGNESETPHLPIQHLSPINHQQQHLQKASCFFPDLHVTTQDKKNTQFLARPSLWLFLPNSFYVRLNSQNTRKAARRKIPNHLLSKNVMPFRNVSPRVSRFGNFEKVGRVGMVHACTLWARTASNFADLLRAASQPVDSPPPRLCGAKARQQTRYGSTS